MDGALAAQVIQRIYLMAYCWIRRSLSVSHFEGNVIKNNAAVVALCLGVSIASSLGTNMYLAHYRVDKVGEVLRVKRIELIDNNENALAVFELKRARNGSLSPELVLRDSSGRDSIDMGVDENGNGVLGFASEQWNVGAVTLGHIAGPGDPVSQAPKVNSKIPPGAWGLRMRSPQGEYMNIGFSNSGEKFVPADERKLH